MNPRKAISKAIRSVPEQYMVEKCLITFRRSSKKHSDIGVFITHPKFEPLIWTKEHGWEKIEGIS